MNEIISGEYNEFDPGNDPQYTDGYCNYCGSEEDDCVEYKCWI
jgi:hypothetical protein